MGTHPLTSTTTISSTSDSTLNTSLNQLSSSAPFLVFPEESPLLNEVEDNVTVKEERKLRFPNEVEDNVIVKEERKLRFPFRTEISYSIIRPVATYHIVPALTDKQTTV